MTTLSAAGSTLWSTGAQAAVDGLTTVRIRGEVVLAIISTTTIGDGFSGYGIGICNVSENAFNAGIASIPSPLIDIGWPGWMWHHLGGELRGYSTTELGTGPMEAVRIPIDSKAMRKLRGTDVTVGVVQLGTETGASILNFTARTRILDKLA